MCRTGESMSEGWYNAVAAARKLGKPIFLVNHRMGNTVEATTSEAAALKFRNEQWSPEWYVVYKRDWPGHMTEVS